MGMLNRGAGVRGRRGGTSDCHHPRVEPLESRRVLSASVLSEPAADVDDLMTSFEAFLRDQAARQYAALTLDAPFPARAPAAGASAAPAAAPAGAGGGPALNVTAPAITTGGPTVIATAPAVTSPSTSAINPDVNSDGVVDAVDLSICEAGIAKYDSGAIPPGAALLADGDATGDGAVNYRDYTVIQTAILAQTPPPTPTNPVLLPGSRFFGPTPQPPAVGSPLRQGYDEKAIARWDVVPYQTFDTTMNVGVLAYHFSGIDRVEFSVNGGRPAAVTGTTVNPQTGVPEYWATLDASKFVADGVVEVRAVAYPKVGVPRVLKSLYLNVNGQHTLPTLVRYVSPTGSNTTGDGSLANPFQTIKQAAMSIKLQAPEENADDGTVYLLPGDYAFSGGWNGANAALPLTEFAWLTVSAAPGVPADQVRITTGGSAERLNTSRVRLANLTLYDTDVVSSNNLNQPAAIWFDHCVLAGSDLTRNINFASNTQWTGGVYATGTAIHDVANGLVAPTFVRDVHVTHIQSDAFMNAEVVVNCTVDDIDSSNSTAHADVVQFFSGAGTTIENRILYGLTATTDINGQGLFAGSGFSLKDIAFVNCRIDNSPNVYYAFQFCGPTRHMYVERSAFSGVLGGTWRVDAGFTAKDVLVTATTFSNKINSVPGVTYR